MTGEEFQREYRLLEKVDDGTVVTHRARDASGDQVLVHYLVEDSPQSRNSLLTYLPRLESEDAARIRTLAEVDGVTVLVTDPLEGFTTLPAWLEEVAGGKAERDPGVYTRLLGRDGPAPIPETQVLDSGNLGQEPEPPEASEEPEETGDPEETGKAQDPETPPDPPASSPPKKTGRPGAFTMVFGDDHGLRGAPPEGGAELAETRVTPASGPPSSPPELAATRITPISGNTLQTPPPGEAAPVESPPPAAPGHTRGEPSTSASGASPAPGDAVSRDIPAPPAPTGSSMSPLLVGVLVVIALIVGVVAGVFLLG